MTETVQIEKPVCPYCGKSDHIIKNGSNAQNKPKLMCKNCHKSFIDPSLRERELRGSLGITAKYNTPEYMKEYMREYRAKHGAKPREFKERFIEMSDEPIIIKSRPLPNFDSLLNVPCFGCKFSERIGTCNPQYCSRLDQFLGVYENYYPLLAVIQK